MAVVSLGFWDLANGKTTIEWFIGSALVAIFGLDDILDGHQLFNRVLRDAIGVTVVVSFVADAYNFGFVVEFILVPIIALLAIVYSFASIRSGDRQLAKASNFLLGLLAFITICNSAFGLIFDFDQFATQNNLRDFLLPVALSLLLLPFLYVLRTVMAYETTFLVLTTRIPSKRIRSYAKLRSLLFFRTDFRSVQRWYQRFMQADSEETVRNSMRALREAQARERNPPVVDPLTGWSPYAAMTFVREFDLEPTEYNPLAEWWSANKMKNLGNDIVGDYLNYSVDGDATIAKRLELSVTSYDSSNATETLTKFFAAASILLNRSVGAGEYVALLNRFARSTQVAEVLCGRTIGSRRETWEGPRPGFSLTLFVSVVPQWEPFPQQASDVANA